MELVLELVPRIGSRSRELRETAGLYVRVKQARDDSPLGSDGQAGTFLLDLIYEICEKRGVTLSIPLAFSVSWADVQKIVEVISIKNNKAVFA